MSLCTTRGTSFGRVILKPTLRTKVPLMRRLWAHGVGETSKACTFSRRNRGRHSSFSSALQTCSSVNDVSLSTFTGSSVLGASAAGIPVGVSAKPLERFSDHARVSFVLRVPQRCSRMELVRCSLVSIGGELKRVGGGSARSSPGVLISLACRVGGGRRMPSSASGGMSQLSSTDGGAACCWTASACSRQNSSSHSASLWMLSRSCNVVNFRFAPAEIEAVIRHLNFALLGSA
mmetsp:Transcript_365/g.951  ORF Transcript_365/g.951 Transcript_365/m.951 type:complete len:233 (+) Transcript_365:327-1025(+)